MQVVGGGQIEVYEPLDEGTHEPGPQAQWQESVVLVWFDQKNAIGGFYRIGHETNFVGGARVVLWHTTFTPEGVFKKSHFIPLRADDRSATHMGSGDGSCSYDFDGNCVWSIDEPELSAQLRVHDFHASIDCYPKKGAIAKFAPRHMEVAGRVEGKLAVKGKEYAVDGLSFRDHSWGERNWESALSHRWVVGVAGADFSFCFLAWQAVDESLAQFGWVVRGDSVTFAKSLDFVAYTDVDGITTRGGRVTATLTTGEFLDVLIEPLVRGTVSIQHGIVCADTLSLFRCGEMTGIADFETSSNPQKGTRSPTKLARGFLGSGWHPAQ